MAKTGFIDQAFFFDPKVWTKRKAWNWIAKRGHLAKKAKRETKRFKGKGEWFGWGVIPVPKSKEGRLRWIPFGPTIMGRFVAPGRKAPAKKKKRNRSNSAKALARATARRAEFLDDERTAGDLSIASMRVHTLDIPEDGLILIGNYRQINYASDKFGQGWIEYHHRPEGFPRVATKLKDTAGGRAFMHPKGAYIVIFPAENQDFRFLMDRSGLKN